MEASVKRKCSRRRWCHRGFSPVPPLPGTSLFFPWTQFWRCPHPTPFCNHHPFYLCFSAFWLWLKASALLLTAPWCDNTFPGLLSASPTNTRSQGKSFVWFTAPSWSLQSWLVLGDCLWMTEIHSHPPPWRNARDLSGSCPGTTLEAQGPKAPTGGQFSVPTYLPPRPPLPGRRGGKSYVPVFPDVLQNHLGPFPKDFCWDFAWHDFVHPFAKKLYRHNIESYHEHNVSLFSCRLR